MSTLFESRASGKLLLTGEYFVLDGAVALAVPVRYGQTLKATVGAKPGVLHWNSLDQDSTTWFQATFETKTLEILTDTDPEIAQTLQSILRSFRQQNPAFLADAAGLEVVTQNDFPRDWGLGTSSTLIAALACWAQADPYQVLHETLGGSGYDIACAYAQGPILYKWNKTHPIVQSVDFQPSFSENIYFVYLGKKQSSREGIERYKKKSGTLKPNIKEINRLTERCLTADSLPAFQLVLEAHEATVSRALDIPTVKTQYFEDFPGAVKSLGAWGGDFVLAATSLSDAETRAYFKEKGFEMVLSWAEMMRE